MRAAAGACGFPLVGIAPAQALDPAPLARWLAAGHAAGMSWMERNVAERLDPTRVLPGARSVLALAIPYHRAGAERSPIARYARGRDYHYAHRDRMKALRKRLLKLDPAIETYACVDTGLAMEKAWAERAGLGWIGKNGCLINPELGSWITLSVMFLDREIDRYDSPHPNLCGECTACLSGCPTQAFPSPGVVDARRCLSYQTIENQGPVPEELRPRFVGRVFGCDICQEVCPFNRKELPEGDARFAPRPLGTMSAEEIAALSPAEFERLAAGMALVRAQYDGLRRNAVLALGAGRRQGARALLERLTADSSAVVAEAARWSLARLG
ncbi:MAG TPA: tRNA epoxyqueuosine(34) reductase QueG [Polyangia bacterium]|nr:tRNA epoxyqueuosine(34) reductase QueG [Polyangia bacterium]